MDRPHVVIAFDANAATNAKVQVARRMLAKELTTRGAVVRIVDIPAEPDVNGPDDYIGAHGAEAFFALTEQVGAAVHPEGSVVVDDFYAYMPAHSYLFLPSREFWPASSVNARIFPIPNGTNDEGEETTISASAWLDRQSLVEQMTWAPGLPELIEGRLVVDGGWIDQPAATCLNLYRPPRITLGDADQAGTVGRPRAQDLPQRRRSHHRWLAHRVQRPQRKINHALVLGGMPGIGKDTLLRAGQVRRRARGTSTRFRPKHLLGRFNGFVKIGDPADQRGPRPRRRRSASLSTSSTKVYAAAPPDVLRVDEKNLREYCRVQLSAASLITTNHETDGFYLPADDRRHYRRLVGLEQGTVPERLLEQALRLVRDRRQRARRRLPRTPSISPVSTRRRRRRRQTRSGRSSTPTARPRTPNSPTCSTR